MAPPQTSSLPAGSNYINTPGMFERFAVLYGAINQPDSTYNETGVAFSLAHLSIHTSALAPTALALLHSELSAAARDVTPFDGGARPNAILHPRLDLACGLML